MTHSFAKLSLTTLVALLAACGGGGGDAPSDSGSGPTVSPAAAQEPTNSFAPGCSNCGAVSASSYEPSRGAGVWQYKNTTAMAQTVNVDIAGAQGRSATFMLTNETSAPVAMGGAVYSTRNESQTGEAVSDVFSAQQRKDKETFAFSKGIFAHLNNTRALSSLSEAPVSPPVAAVVGASRTWTNCGTLNYSTLACQDVNPNVPSTLAAQRTTADGWTVNVWVADAERGVSKVTDAMAQNLAAAYAQPNGVHASLTALGGLPWGSHEYSNLLSAQSKEINLVVANLTPDQQPLGLVGFFWSLNNLTKSSAPASNEALVLFLDSETAYLAQGGVDIIKNTLSHEATHMRNFYQRSLKQGQPFDLWLEEFTAMATEELLAESLAPGSSPAVSNRLPYLLRYGSSSCDVRGFSSEAGYCFGYAVGGSFGAYLLRNYGPSVLQGLLNSDIEDNEAVLTAALQAARPGTTLAAEVRRWHQATFTGMSASRAPKGLSYPALTASGFTLPAIDMAPIVARHRNLYSAPNFLTPTSSHVWTVVSGTSLQRSVRVPAGLTLSVVLDQ